jgi:hypothetical protein
VNDMNTTYALMNPTSGQTLQPELPAAQSRGAAAAEARARPVVAKAQGASLPVALSDLHRGHRGENVAWAVLALSSAVLLILSLWL